MSRRWLLADAVVLLPVLALALGAVRFDGWGSVSIGGNLDYCSVWHWVHFSCQAGH